MSTSSGALESRRLDELEIKLAFVEQLVVDLNDALTAESARVTILERQLDRLQQRVNETGDGTAGDGRGDRGPAGRELAGRRRPARPLAIWTTWA